VFDVSWRQLDPAEQATFSSLTIFRGGFTREAARQVVAGADASSGRLATLVRKSFLQYDQVRDRYSIHELLRQYGAEKLAEEPAREAEARDLHSAYYARAMQGWEQDLTASRVQAALSEMEADSENIRAAWTWAVGQLQIERLDEAMEGLERFHWHSGRYQEAIEALGAAAAAARKVAERIDDKVACLRVATRALAWQSDFCRTMGHWDAARRIQQQCLTMLEDPALVGCDTRLERAILAGAMGTSDVMGDPVQAKWHFQESFSLFRELDHRWGIASALMGWGTTSARLGAHQDARQRFEEALAIFQSCGNPSGVAAALGHLAFLTRAEGRFEEAEALAREGYTSALGAGSRHHTGQHQAWLAKALKHLGRFSEAHAAVQQSVALFSELGNRSFVIQGRAILADIDLHWGRYQEARDHAEAALAGAREHGPQFTVALSLLLVGCVDLAEGAPDRACQHLEKSIAVYREAGPQDELSWAFAALGLATLGLGDARGARPHLLQALRLALGLRAFPSLLWTLPAMALLLGSEGEDERAVELYALAMRYPSVAKSRWFRDVAGGQLAGVAAALPAGRVAVLRKHGQAHDLFATAAELIAELGA
jgi:tetratricopeptide (TPR) repeat protein